MPLGLYPNSPDLNLTWSRLEKGVDHLLDHLETPLQPDEYYDHRDVYNHCVNSRINEIDQINRKRGASLVGQDLYEVLRAYLRQHVNKTRVDRLEPRIPTDTNQSTHDEFLSQYVREYNRYAAGSNFIRNVFSYLNRHWVRREVDEGNKQVYDIYNMCFVTWRTHLFVALDQPLLKAMLHVIEKDRDGIAVDTSNIKTTLDAIVIMDIPEPSETPAPEVSLDMYKQHFETPFLAATEAYYVAESARYLAEHPFTAYLTRAESRFKEEENRISLYLHPTTGKPLMDALDRILVAAHQPLFWRVFGDMLQERRITDLRRLFFLSSRVSSTLPPLREAFEAHVKEVGLQTVTALHDATKETLEPKQYIDTVLSVHGQFLDLVREAFAMDPGFVASMDKACREYMNRNVLTKDMPTKTPELLARFCDGLLRKGTKAVEESEVEAQLSLAMVVFKYVEDKDVFQKFYTNHLAKRLVYGSSASVDAEASMITKLRDACGFEYTSKLQRMFTDINTSKDTDASFREVIGKNRDQQVDLSVFVLTTGIWPFTPMTIPFALPRQVEKVHAQFEQHYLSKRDGRKLTWLYHLSKAEVVTTFLKNKYIFQVHTYSMAILLQFNEQLQHTLQSLMDNTRLDQATVEGQLGILVKARVLLSDADPSDVQGIYTLNTDYKGKKLKVNLAVPIRAEVRQEAEDTNKTVEEDRKMLMQAAIVRIMKTRKQMKHVMLVQEVVQQLQSRFKPKIPDIKKSIDLLLEKDYIERVEGAKDTYNYLA